MIDEGLGNFMNEFILLVLFWRKGKSFVENTEKGLVGTHSKKESVEWRRIEITRTFLIQRWRRTRVTVFASVWLLEFAHP